MIKSITSCSLTRSARETYRPRRNLQSGHQSAVWSHPGGLRLLYQQSHIPAMRRLQRHWHREQGLYRVSMARLGGLFASLTISRVERRIFNLDVDLVFFKRRQYCFFKDKCSASLNNGGGFHGLDYHVTKSCICASVLLRRTGQRWESTYMYMTK